jgi:two-component system response regulator AtoC
VIEDIAKIAQLLVISDDSGVLDVIWSYAKANGWQVALAADAWEAIDKIHSGLAPDLLVLDMPHDPCDGLQILRTLRRIYPTLPLVLIGQTADLERKQEAIRMGARDYLIRPFPSRQLEMVIRHSLSTQDQEGETDITSDDVEPVGNDNYFIGIGPVMRRLRSRVALLAEMDFPVFLVGEPGSGRETIARLLHRLSVRSGFEFARVNCAVLPEELLEREIFGCEAAGAAEFQRTKRGKLEVCNQGTIFLDEITEMPLRLQDKLAQVLRDGRFTKSGRPDGIEVDVRVVAASSISVHQAVSERQLFAELSRALSDYELQVPALRERKEELPFLSRHFMHQLAKRYGLPPRDIPPTVSQAWQAHDWPGNLRELEQSVKRYLVAGDREFALEDTSPETKDEVQVAASKGSRNGNTPPQSSRQARGEVGGYKSLRSLLQSVKEEAERSAIALALEETGWNRKAAARLLKTSYRTVLYKIEQYQMNSSDFSQSSARNGSDPGKTVSHNDAHTNVPSIDLPRVVSGRSNQQ